IQFSPALGGQTIAFTTVGDHTLGPAALGIYGSTTLTIDGQTTSGDVTIARSTAAGTPNMRLINIFSNNANVTLQNLTLTNGDAQGGTGAGNGGGAAGFGGGIFNDGATLTLLNSTISNSPAHGGNGGSLSTSDSIPAYAGGGGGGGLDSSGSFSGGGG